MELRPDGRLAIAGEQEQGLDALQAVLIRIVTQDLDVVLVSRFRFWRSGHAHQSAASHTLVRRL